MMELLGLCDRIAVMREGRVVTVIEGEKATEENIMRAAMGLYGEAGS
jgi:ABC-type sugar transport system ATPase subunit